MSRPDYKLIAAEFSYKYASHEFEEVATKEMKALLEEAADRRISLAKEICDGLKKRGYWVPKDVESSDVLCAVFQAIDKLEKQLQETYDLAIKTAETALGEQIG